MKVKNSICLILILLITVGLACGTYFGLSIGGKQIIPGVSQMRMGLDIAGGVRLVYKPEGENITADGLRVAQTVFRNRLDVKGLNEATVTIDDTSPDNPMIVVEIPGFTDPKEASDFLGKTAKLQFIETTVTQDEDGHTTVTPTNIVIEGDDIVGAKSMYGPVSGDAMAQNEYYIQLELSDEAVTKFADATERNIGGSIWILLDDQILMTPMVSSRIETKNPIITGGSGESAYTAESSKEMAELISSGALPFTLKIENEEYIGPTIGQEAFTVTLKAGIIAFIIVAILLILVYRVPGFLTVVGLVLFGSIFLLIHQWCKITITLPGIAGIILTIAMAVDASVIIYERFREEIKAGKTLRTAVDLSFNRAFSAVRDSNLTTIISGCILWYFGTGPVKGFAIALVVGTVLSFIVSMVALRFMMQCVSKVIDKPNKHVYGI